MFNGNDTYGLLQHGDRLLVGVCHLHTLIFMSGRHWRGETSRLSPYTGMLGTLEVAGLRRSEAELNLVKRTAIMSASDGEIIAVAEVTP